jgi:hypothetical protein
MRITMFSAKTEIRRPKTERRLKSEIRILKYVRAALRASVFGFQPVSIRG